MNPDDDIDEEERRLFRQAMKEVRPLADDRVHARPSPPDPRPRQREADEAAVRETLASGMDDPLDADIGEELFHARPGIQKRVLRKLRRGQYAMQAELDLHGMTRAEAAGALADFLADCRVRGLTGVRIIHGKGRRSSNQGPILKPAVAGWLRRRSEVLAFCSARPMDGGSGALYVLLSRR